MIKTRNTLILILIGFITMSFRVNQNKLELSMSKTTDTMIGLPDSNDPLVVRTYFNNDKDWNIISKKLTDSYVMGFKAYIELLNDKQFENATVEEIVEKSKSNYKHNFIFVADSLTFSNLENTI